jgi:RNA polymerase sigma factor (sigma-70 family)
MGDRPAKSADQTDDNNGETMPTKTQTRSASKKTSAGAEAGPVATSRPKRSLNPKKDQAATSNAAVEPAKKTVAKKTAAKKPVVAKPAPKAADTKAPTKKAAAARTAVVKKPAGKAVTTKSASTIIDDLDIEFIDDTDTPEKRSPAKDIQVVVEDEIEEEIEEEVEEIEVPVIPEPIDYNDRNTTLFTERNRVKTDLNKLLAMTEKRRPADYARRLHRAYRDLDSITTQIVKFNYGLVRSYTKKFTSNSSRDDSADFEASAVVGLMRAIDSFDPTKGRFGAWAYKPIQREVLRAVRDADFKSMNPGDFERRPDILRAVAKIQAGDDTRMPTNAAVAAEARVTVDQVRRVLEAPHLESIHQRVGDDGATELGDLIESDTTGVEGSVLSAMTLTALEDYGFSALDERELFVLIRRFGLDCEPEQKLASIGDMLGLSREAVRQVEAKALAKIMHPTVIRKIVRYGRA